MSQRADFLRLIIDVRAQFSQDHFMADLGVRELRRFLRDNLSHHLSNGMFLGAVDASVAERDDVHSSQVLVDGVGGENAVHSCAASPYEASEIVCRVFMALEDCVASVAGICDDQEV